MRRLGLVRARQPVRLDRLPDAFILGHKGLYLTVKNLGGLVSHGPQGLRAWMLCVHIRLCTHFSHLGRCACCTGGAAGFSRCLPLHSFPLADATDAAHTDATDATDAAHTDATDDLVTILGHKGLYLTVKNLGAIVSLRGCVHGC